MAGDSQLLVRPSPCRVVAYMAIAGSLGLILGFVLVIAMLWIFFDVMESPLSSIDFMPYLLNGNFALLVCACWLLAVAIGNLFPRDIFVTEQDITGPPIGFGFHPVKVSTSSVDVLRSSHWSMILKLLGTYNIYNQDGTGFQFNKYGFSRAERKKIIDRIHDVLGVKLD